MLLVITAARLQLALPLPPSVNGEGFEFPMSLDGLLEETLQPLHAVLPEVFLQQDAGVLQSPPPPPPPPTSHHQHITLPPWERGGGGGGGGLDAGG